MNGAAVLPPLRDELAIHIGPVGHDGAPTWILHDPVRNQFFRLDWPSFEMLSRWPLGLPELVATAISTETTLDIEADDVAQMVAFLAQNQLLKPSTPQDVARLLAIHDSGRTGWLTWALHHYLFFRLPLVRPDRMLNAMLPYVGWIGSRMFRWATLLALVLGLVLVGRQWNSFAATFVDQVSMEGLVAFGVALGLAKILHEMGHALTAKSYGLRVPTMGVAFLVLFPMLYTDVNEAWTLASRRRRLMVGAAGILTELGLAAWATLAWGLLPDGTLRSMAFTLAATTWISSLAINLSPFMRFDGYFLAMDALDQPNLHPRSFALGRWHLREVLFGLGEPPPELLPPRTRSWMIVFAWAVWVYRLILFLGIAVLVYHFFIKAVGVLLFVVEIWWFVLRPLHTEFKEWKKRAGAIRATRRSRLTLGLCCLLALLAIVPWNGRVSAPALLKAREHVTIYAPAPGMLVEQMVRNGDEVAAGAVLARLHNPDIDLRLRQTSLRINMLKYELESVGFYETFRSRSQANAHKLEAELAEQSALRRQLDRLTLNAPVAGIVTDVSPMVQAGQWISPKEPILGIRSGSLIDAYVTEDDLQRIQTGASATFIPEGSGTTRAATIVAIDPTALRTLADPEVTTPFGGTIPARIDGKSLVPDVAVYRVRLSVEGSEPVALLRGKVHIEGERRSPLGHIFKTAAAILIREWGA